MFSNSVLISWRVRAVHLFHKVIFVKTEFVRNTSALLDYLRYIKKKRACQVSFTVKQLAVYLTWYSEYMPGFASAYSLSICFATFGSSLSHLTMFMSPFSSNL